MSALAIFSYVTSSMAALAAASAPPSSIDGSSRAPFVLAVGVNDPGEAASGLAPLAFADDDAVEAVRLFTGADTSRARLLTVMDADTQREAPAFARIARAPSVSELRRAVAELVGEIDRARAAGEAPIVHVWLSGHASYDDDGHAVFPLAGGALSAQRFLDDVVRPLARAHRVHLFIDTCFASALVRAKAAVQSVEPALAEATFLRRGLADLPNVGAFVAASPASAAYEWEEVRAGVFSALTRAGLRGAADADRDDVVRYSELGAFLAASTDAVSVAPARPKIALYPPALEQDAIVHARAKDARTALLDDDLSSLGPVSIVDGQGAFLLAAAFEPGFRPRLWLPTERGLYLRARGVERPLVEDDGRLTVGEERPLDVRSRSLVARALEEGLFKTPFGPAFYRGYRVTTVTRMSATVDAGAPVQQAERSVVVPALFFGLAGVAGVVTLGAGAASALFIAQLVTTTTERKAYESFAAASFTGGIAAGALVVVAAGIAGGTLAMVE